MRARRVGYFVATMAAVAAMIACSSGNGYTYIATSASEGRVEGVVLLPDTTPAAGIVVTASPASLTSPASTTTGGDGRFELRAPAGQVTLRFTGTGIETTTLTVTVVSNQLTIADDVTVTLLP